LFVRIGKPVASSSFTVNTEKLRASS